MSQRYSAILAAIVVLLGSGLACHLLARDSGQLDDAVARVAQVPRVVGAWKAEDEVVDEALFRNAGARGHWTRLYVNQRTKDSVLVILMCGRSGKMAVHTPEVCYRGAGYDLPAEASVTEIKPGPGQEGAKFWTAQFTKKGSVPTSLRLYWAWNAHGAWEASASPRWQFRGEPFLYKLYVSRSQSPGNVTGQAEPTVEFLKQFVPVLQQTLFAQGE